MPRISPRPPRHPRIHFPVSRFADLGLAALAALALLAALLLAGCADDPQGIAGPDGPAFAEVPAAALTSPVTIDFEGFPTSPPSTADFTGGSEDGFDLAVLGGRRLFVFSGNSGPGAPFSGKHVGPLATGGNAAVTDLEVKQTDGQPFAFLSLDFARSPIFALQDLVVTGYLGGSVVGSDAFTFGGSGAVTGSASNLAAVNVDRLVISLPAGAATASELDNLVLGPCNFIGTVSNEAELNAAIGCFNQQTAPGTYTIALDADIDLTASTTHIDNATAGVALEIQGNGHIVDGQGTVGVRPFYIEPNTTVLLHDLTVSGGNVTGQGPGGGIENRGFLTVERILVVGNEADVGGGINSNGDVTIRNATVSGNSATRGGGVYVAASTRSSIESSTIVGNTADDDGSGLFVGIAAVVGLRNTIIADNLGVKDCSRSVASVIDQGHNLVESQSNAALSRCVDAGGNDNIVGQDPMLGPLADNGGPTHTHALLPGSPAIDAGDTDLTDDQRGVARPQGAADDIGAFEAEVVQQPTLEVTKTALTFLTRTWTWDIDKTGDHSQLTLAPDQVLPVGYDVTVEASPTDSGWNVGGVITIHNPSGVVAMITAVTDEIDGFGAAAVTCTRTLPFQLGPGESTECLYGADLPDGKTRTNTATVATEGPVGGGSGTAEINFANPFRIEEVDGQVDVSDDKAGPQGSVLAANAPKTFEYMLDVGPYASFGDYTFLNTASFVTRNTATTGSDTWTIRVKVPSEGCTLTPGYWKTHSSYGPARRDARWENILGAPGADTPFFLSGQTYYQVLGTPPSGNAYYNLAHAYIAAQLNRGIVSDFSAAQAAFDEATALFNTYTPAHIGALKGNRPPRADFLRLAKVLDDFNSGVTGPGHCSE